MKKLTFFALLLIGSIVLMGSGGTHGKKKAELNGFDQHVKKDGSFRFSGSQSIEGLAHLGSWFVPAGDAAGFHGVYTQPEAIEHFQKTGRFADGTVLIKELRGHNRANYTTGADVASATGVGQWFLMVKDSKGRFPKNPLWGEGWGWALFKADNPELNVATDYQTDCLGCHTPAKENDWIYTQGYPALTEK